MRGGARDEVVPRSQMQELWAIIRNRGCDTANKKTPAGSVNVKGAAAEEEDKEDEDEKYKDKGKGKEKEKEKEDIWVGSSRSRPTPMPATGSRSRSYDRTVVSKIVVDGGNTLIEFPRGMHSELCLLKSLVAVSCSLRLCR
jgi:hypothetical protein